MALYLLNLAKEISQGKYRFAPLLYGGRGCEYFSMLYVPGEQEEKPRGFLLPSHRHQRKKRLDTTPYHITMEKIHICTGTPTVDPVITVSVLSIILLAMYLVMHNCDFYHPRMRIGNVFT